MKRDATPPSTDLNTVIDAVWPQLRAAQKRGWRHIFAALFFYAIIVVATQLVFDDLAAKIVAFGGIIALVAVVILAQTKVAKAGAPLVPQILRIAGFDTTDADADVGNYPQRGLLPLRGTVYPGDYLICDLGPHRLERIAVNVSKITRDSDGSTDKKVYFSGDLFRINALPRQATSQLVVRVDRSRGSREITRRFATHHNMTWRSKDRTKIEGLGTVMQSPDGDCAKLLDTLQAARPYLPPHRSFFSALREDDTLVIALLGGAPSLSVGGLVMSRYSVEQKVDKILRDLSATLALAQAVIIAETTG